MGRQRDFVFKDTLDFNITLSDEKASSLVKSVCEIDQDIPETIAYQGQNISGAQMKRINLARMISQSSSLLLDEPFQGLSAQQAKTIEAYLLANTNFLMLVSHVWHKENLPLYTGYLVVENHEVKLYRELPEFEATDYYRRNMQ